MNQKSTKSEKLKSEKFKIAEKSEKVKPNDKSRKTFEHGQYSNMSYLYSDSDSESEPEIKVITHVPKVAKNTPKLEKVDKIEKIENVPQKIIVPQTKAGTKTTEKLTNLTPEFDTIRVVTHATSGASSIVNQSIKNQEVNLQNVSFFSWFVNGAKNICFATPDFPKTNTTS